MISVFGSYCGMSLVLHTCMSKHTDTLIIPSYSQTSTVGPAESFCIFLLITMKVTLHCYPQTCRNTNTRS
mgnify:CR=1 FL=1